MAGIGRLYVYISIYFLSVHPFEKLSEYRFKAWPRIFVIVFPSFIIFWAVSITVPDLFLNSPLANHFDENAEGIARNIESGLSYIGGALIALFIGLWKKKNLPLRRLRIIDKVLDKIFGKDEVQQI